MKLSDSNKLILEEIVVLEGNCLKRERCEKCPFKMSCLPEFLNTAPTKNQRLEMALDLITRDIILEDSEDSHPLWYTEKSKS
jgi:hypothetical protein